MYYSYSGWLILYVYRLSFDESFQWNHTHEVEQSRTSSVSTRLTWVWETKEMVWVVESWESLPMEMIVRSFKACRISDSLDGTENELIRGFRQFFCPELRRRGCSNQRKV